MLPAGHYAQVIGLTFLLMGDPAAGLVAGSDLIFRHSALQTVFGEEHPTGQDSGVVAQPGYEAWVEEQWKRFTGSAED